MNWIEGFTLLHWAAEKGLADFCRSILGVLELGLAEMLFVRLRYFVALNADPNATDSRGCLGTFFGDPSLYYDGGSKTIGMIGTVHHLL